MLLNLFRLKRLNKLIAFIQSITIGMFTMIGATEIITIVKTIVIMAMAAITDNPLISV